jgi:alcohol dehydrogenase (cytochrome c)
MLRILVPTVLCLALTGAEARGQDGPTQAELTGATSSTDWLYVTHDYSGQRYVDLGQITASNAPRLRPVCAFQASDVGSFQANPIVYRGVMYVTTRFSTIALDAATCRERWRHSVEPPLKQPETFGDMLRVALPNRGAALKDGKLVRGLPDGRLIALRADSGTLLWERRVADTAATEMLNMPPLVFEDLVVIGPGLSEAGIRGWIGAFRLADGEPVWKFHTVPDSGAPGSETWENTGAIPHGGGAVWTPLSLDPEEGTLYVSAGNPAPDLAGHARPGDNLYTNSLVALDVRTGALKWYRQMLPHDVHDWDLTQVSPLFTASVAGTPRHLVATAGKDGMLRVLDRDSHEILYETPVTTRLNVDVPVGREPVQAFPGFLGGVQWNGPAFNRRTGLLYVPAVDWCGTVAASDSVEFVPGGAYFGGEATLDTLSSGTGWLTAVEATTGRIRWRYRAESPVLGGVTTTGGGVVFTGEAGGDFLALDARNGKVLYRFHAGGPVAGGVVTYAVGGRQLVAVASGSLAGFWRRKPGSATVFVFALP